MKNYTAFCRRSGRWWAVSVPEVKGAHTQVRRLDQVDAAVREVLALMLDAPASSFAITLDVRPPKSAQRVIRDAVTLRHKAEALDATVARKTDEAVAAMLASGLTVRDCGELLGVSPQRISQLAKRAGAAK